MTGYFLITRFCSLPYPFCHKTVNETRRCRQRSFHDKRNIGGMHGVVFASHEVISCLHLAKGRAAKQFCFLVGHAASFCAGSLIHHFFFFPTGKASADKKPANVFPEVWLSRLWPWYFASWRKVKKKGKCKLQLRTPLDVSFRNY